MAVGNGSRMPGSRLMQTAFLVSGAVVLILALLVSPQALESRGLAGLSILQPGQRHSQSHAPLSLFEPLADQAPGDRVADQAPGGRAVAHFAGGAVIRSRALQRKAPVAQLYPTGTQAAEPTLGIDKDGTFFYVGTDFVAPPAPDNKLEFPVLRSDDGGRTWEEVSPRLGPQRRHAVVGLDPMLHVDTDTGRVFTADLQTVACSTVSSSDDKGETWTTSEACGLTDHQNVFTGPPAISTTIGYPNVVYYCAIDGGALAAFGTMTSCLKSLDGGLTWARTGSPAFRNDPSQDGGQMGIPGHCGGATGHGVVDDKGTIYLPRGWCGQPYLAISKDEGRTWERVQVADNGMPFDEGSELEEHEAGVAVDSEGNLYYIWTARDRLIYLATSTDGGKKWSEPMMIGFPGTKETWGPTIAVGSRGKVAVAYIGSTDAPGGESPQGDGDAYKDIPWNGYLTITANALEKKPVFFSGSINDVRDPLIIGSCSVIRCQHEFDFIDVVIAPDGTPWTSMVDGYNKEGKPYNATFGNGIVGGFVGGPSLK